MPLPRHVPLFMVIGAPIPVPKVSPDDRPRFDAAVDDAHARLVEALQALFDKYKGAYDARWADRTLSIE